MIAPTPPLLSRDQYLERLLQTPRPGEKNILAFYEHRLGAICTSPRLMLLPLDDHLAHRGDGIFETIKYTAGRMYQLDEHLERMIRSAEGIFLSPPCPWSEIRSIILATAGEGKEQTGLMRVLMGRGPGGFGISPGDSPAASLYVVAYRFTPRTEQWYAAGLKGFRTTIPAKQGYLARIKNANYLPNVLMMYEAEKRGMDVPFCFDEQGYLAESAIANICLVNREGVIEVPQFTNSLPGTTVRRALELLKGQTEYVMRSITEDDILDAREVLMLGTGPDCAAVVSYEGKAIGDGRRGKMAELLRWLIDEDIRKNGVPVPGLT